MRIESGLYASREGMHVHGQALGVVSDNISNSNTTAYKTSRIEFSDLMAEGGEGRASTAEDAAGNGAQIADVRTLMEPGLLEFTGRSLDAGIEGQGFFLAGDPAAPGYTRAGNFSIDGSGLLVSALGAPILGYPTGTTTLSTIDLENFDTSGTATTEASMFANLFSGDDLADAVPNNPISFQEIGRSANFISSMQVFDSLGVGHDLTVAFFKTDVNTWTVQAYANGEEAGGTAGAPVQIGQNATLNFATDGSIAEGNAAAAVVNATPAWAGGAEAGNFNIDFSGMTQFGGATVVRAIEQNGEGAGEINDYEIAADGTIFGVLEGGTRVEIAQLPLATFGNPEGLQRIGNSIYAESDDSGTATLGTAGTGGSGVIKGAALELSSTDIAKEFTDLVVYQRGYQANSSSFSTIDDVISGTLNLIR